MVEIYDKLIKYIESVKDKPFIWGEHDCCMFANNCMIAMTGNNFMSEFVGKYNDQASAGEALRKYGAGHLYHTMLRKFGKARHISLAKRGDIVYKNGKGLSGPSLGICFGDISYFVGDDGLIIFNTLECSKTWVKS